VRHEEETLVDEAGGPPVVVEEDLPPPPPPGPPRGPLLWPWLLLLLVLVIGGLVLAWFLTHRGHHHHRSAAVVVVPNVVGKREGSAVAEMNRRGLVSRVQTRPSSLPAGTVFAEHPAAGSRVTRGSAVTLETSAASVVVVPNVVGKTAAAAVSALRAKGLTVQTSTVTTSKPNGTVVSQSPASGSKVAKGSTAVIRVSRGLVQVPDVVGQSRPTALAAIRGAGLVPTAVSVPSTQPRGTIVAQHPAGRKRVPRGSKVQLNTAKGSNAAPPPPPSSTNATIPDVTGQQQDFAQKELNDAGFKPKVVYVPSDDPEGTIVAQSPTGGTTTKAGRNVQINASLGPNATALQPVPNTLGLTRTEATSRLRDAGFKVQTLTRKTTSKSQDGKVLDEQPRRAPGGSTVTIYLGRFFELR
jgi:beta-lactam-binding protein with PASTA domain